MTQIELTSNLHTAESPIEAAITNSQVWLDLLARVYGYSSVQLFARDTAGQTTGYLPLCLIQSALTGRRLVALPFADYCPLLALDEASAHDLVNQAVSLARERRARYLELRAGENALLSARPDLALSDLYVRWTLPLSPNPDNVWATLRKPIQHQVKKSRKLGVTIRVAERKEDMAAYYHLHLLTRCKKHGMPAQPLRYFYELWDTFEAAKSMQLLLAEYEGQVIAGMVLLSSGGTIRYAYGASHERYLHLAPNNLLLWTAITLGCGQGYSTFDLGRTARDNEGLMEFKRRWGATQESLPYYYFPHVEGLVSTSEQSLKFRLLTSCWKRLPTGIAGPVGGYFYRHMG